MGCRNLKEVFGNFSRQAGLQVYLFSCRTSQLDILNFVNRASGPAVKEPKKTLAALGETSSLIGQGTNCCSLIG